MRPESQAAIVLTVLIGLVLVPRANGQGGHTLYGDIRVDESKVTGLKPLSLDITLYTEGRMIVSRQTVSTSGRYRFNNLSTGFYDLVVEVEAQEIARVRVDLSSPLIGEVRRDLFLEWTPIAAKAAPKSGVISASDRFERTSANSALFEKASRAIDKKHYDEAIRMLQTIVAADPKDFQAWTELGNVHLLQKKYKEAEFEYLRAIDLHTGFFPALINLGRLEVARKNYDVAIAVLTRAVNARPDSVDANYLLGASYLQIKKGSVAVSYLNEALRLDPKGMAEVHLSLALLYNGAGMKDKAATEYEQFLKQRPKYSDRKKLEKYITENKKH
jgi:tetratricopeptide (TPR) repeat protein